MNLERFLFFCFCFGTWNSASASKKKSLNMDPVDLRDWGLPVDQQYPQFFELTSTYFHHKIMANPDAWIVVIHQDKIRKKWKRHAERSRGTIWYGSVDYDKERELAYDLIENIGDYNLEDGVGLVFPFGLSHDNEVALKNNQWPKIVTEPDEAEKLLKPTFPAVTNEFTFKQADMTNFQNWIVDAYYKSQPPRFPVLCITDEPTPFRPISLLAISNYFDKFFSFGVVYKDYLNNMFSLMKEVPNPQMYPHYLLLMGKEPTSKQMSEGKFGLTFDVMPFNPKKYGESYRFLAVVKFLFTVNEDYREILLGRRADEDISLQKMQSVIDALKVRVRKVSRNPSKYTLKTEL